MVEKKSEDKKKSKNLKGNVDDAIENIKISHRPPDWNKIYLQVYYDFKVDNEELFERGSGLDLKCY